ncbi:MAG: hypothetical protein M3M85_04210 [bacterium]|nr:hypothetical protein [bacterium]
MKINPREKAESYSLPLPIYQSFHIADAFNKQGEEFGILVGLDKKYVEELRALSADETDTDLQNFTSDRKRFVEGTYEHWYQKNRSLYALIHKQSDNLAALVWFGPKPLGKKSMKFENASEEESSDAGNSQSEWHTISFRAYSNHRGTGMMKRFTEFAMAEYKKQFPNVKFWAGTDDRNDGSVGLLQSLGYHIDSECSDLVEHWLIMVKA